MAERNPSVSSRALIATLILTFSGAAVAAPARVAPTIDRVDAPAKPPPEPIRAERSLALLGELGWNGLAGFGPILAYHATPHWTFEAGTGASAVGWKASLRSRYNLLETELTPFVGLGFIYGSGSQEDELELDDSEGRQIKLKVKSSPFLQAVVGLDWTTPSGFTLVGATGYAHLLRDETVRVVSGEPSREHEDAMRLLFRSGLVISVALGYSFR